MLGEFGGKQYVGQFAVGVGGYFGGGFCDCVYSKLVNVLFIFELVERLEGISIIIYLLHSGVVVSDIWRKVLGLLCWIGKLFMISNEEGV